LEAQQTAVRDYLNGGDWGLVAEVTEVESGKRSDRPKLAEALKLCRLHGAALIIAKLDRLARNVAFISNLMESGVKFHAVDFPQANRLTVHILAAVAEHEAKVISERTKAALAAAKRRGVKLGGYRGTTMTKAMRRAAAEAVAKRVDASRPDHCRAKGGGRDVTAGHRSGLERAQHSYGSRRSMVGGASEPRSRTG
jgi:DNA invertase Pin-like site-specific DNA recombinase